MSGFIDVGPKHGLRQYAELLTAAGFDADKITRTAQVLTAYYDGNDVVRDALRGELTLLLEVEKRWYDSLARGEPDYGIYESELYLADVWACWTLYSRGYLRLMARYGLLDGLDGLVVADLGCGVGLTTRALADLLPASRVIGTNRDDTSQMRLARLAANQFGFEVADGLPEAADVVFASEYFEHFEEPVAHLRDVLATGASHLFTANTFGPKAPGHFDVYVVDGVELPPRKAARAFDAELRERGFEKVETRMWNGRPTYWRLDGKPQPQLRLQES